MTESKLCVREKLLWFLMLFNFLQVMIVCLLFHFLFGLQICFAG